MKVDIHNVVKWDVQSKSLKTDSGAPFEIRDIIIQRADGEEIKITMFLADEEDAA